MSKVMTKESRVVLSGRYDRKGCRTRVVIPEYRLGQCVNITHWRGGDEERLEKALPGHLEGYVSQATGSSGDTCRRCWMILP